MKYLIIIIGVVANAMASVLIKYSHHEKWATKFTEPLTVLTNWPLMCGILLYGVAFVSYALALKFFPLNIAHPTMTAGAIALVGLISVLFMNETYSSIHLMGLIIIFIGMILINLKI